MYHLQITKTKLYRYTASFRWWSRWCMPV